jgi:toxin-antitoxin system PIN domain toxin
MHLPDINVWLALTFTSHIHHPAARSWFEGLAENRGCYFCRFTQQGFLRLANNPKAFPGIAVNQDVAWQLFDAFAADPRVGYLTEPPQLEETWRKFTQLPRLSPHSWSDAYLAAFAQLAGLEIVTFDQGFKQYPAVKCTLLS